MNYILSLFLLVAVVCLLEVANAQYGMYGGYGMGYGMGGYGMGGYGMGGYGYRRRMYGGYGYSPYMMYGK